MATNCSVITDSDNLATCNSAKDSITTFDVVASSLLPLVLKFGIFVAIISGIIGIIVALVAYVKGGFHGSLRRH